MSWNAELEAERTYVPSPTEDTKASTIARAGADDVELDSPVKSASPEVKRGGRRLDGGDKVIAASPKRAFNIGRCQSYPRCPRTSRRRSSSV